LGGQLPRGLSQHICEQQFQPQHQLPII
jgi:hypothetical protein